MMMKLWRFASLYGIGRDINRLPYLEGQNLQQMMNLKEIGLIFPTLLDILQIKSPPNHFIENVWFAHKECCEYENPKSLLTLKGKYLKIKGNYLQSYRYFHNYKTEIRNIFKCGKSIEESNKDFTEKLFANDTKSFKLCAHFRRDELLENEMLESKEDFIYPALDYAIEYLKSAKRIDNKISLIFIGDDYLFAKNLSIKNGFYKNYIFEPQSRGEDMCLGINYCDSMILTASGSAFGWWISYLMKENSTIFYNSKIGKSGKSKKDIYDFDIFPKEWIKLSVENGKAKKEEKWWREKIHF
uniref:Alpha-1,2-fucosyltransferase n=1 Tax=Panagrolaimus sp. PS1159 TaxID=55785 RepID=A0AC35GRM9_9BILA